MLPAPHQQNLLINNAVLGSALAESLDTSTVDLVDERLLPQHGVVYIRGNGAVVWSDYLEDAVYKAVNMQRNAEIQTAAMLQRVGSDMEIIYLNRREAVDCAHAGSELVQS